MCNRIRSTHLLFIILIISWSFAFSAASQEEQKAKEQVTKLVFGLYQSDKASVMHSKFNPLITYLSGDISKVIAGKVEVSLKIYRSYQQANDALVKGEVDFVRFGPASYVIAKNKAPKIQLLAMEEKKGKTRFNGLIVVNKNSPFNTLSDLSGKSFAFGNETSTIGRYLAQSELLKVGINAKKLSNYAFLGRHDKVFKAVALGDFQAGSLKESTFNKMNKTQELKVLHRFDNVTKPWVARAGLASDLKVALSNALISITDKALLKQFKVSRFVKTSDAEYQYVRKAMKISQQF